MMKIETNVPDPKFSLGDVVKRTNTTNDGAIYLRVTQIYFVGTWRWEAPSRGIASGIFPLEGYYLTVVQEGSVHDCPESLFMRPGKLIPTNRQDLEEYESVEYDGPVHENDTLENIDAREAAWRGER